MKYDLQDSWTEDTANGKVMVVNVVITVADPDPALARQMVKDLLERAGLSPADSEKQDAVLS